MTTFTSVALLRSPTLKLWPWSSLDPIATTAFRVLIEDYERHLLSCIPTRPAQEQSRRNYEAVLDRFLDFFRERDSIGKISAHDLTHFMVALKKGHRLGANTVLHNAIIIA